MKHALLVLFCFSQVAATGENVLSSRETFPIAVWLQAPANAAKYRAIGINVYVGLWRGPTEAQLKALADAGMSLICHQNDLALRSPLNGIIVGWMHGDEPDNAQSLGQGRGWGPPIPPERIVQGYERMKRADATRPVLLNLGQGVAWDCWHGRGVRTNHPEDYPEYVKGCDIASFDIYPVTHDNREVAGNLWYVARGVQRLREWTGGKKPVWACIECTRISNPDRKPTPEQVRSEVWMAIIHGANGLIYFCHEFRPRFIEAGLLADEAMASAVGRINRQIQSLAAVLNSPTLEDAAKVQSASPVATLVKRQGGSTYVFAVAMRDAATRAAFAVEGIRGRAKVEVLDEGRTIEAADGKWEDDFAGYAVHLYRISEQQ